MVIDFLHLCLLPDCEVMYMCGAASGAIESRPIGVGMVLQ